MREIEKLKEAILREYPRLTRESSFTFACHKGVPCFNECCGDVNIFLTPYDIIRLKKNLGISSSEFLGKYTISPFDENLKYPIVMLKMNDDKKKSCPFVGQDGCKIYPDRPWACRMYPLGLASPSDDSKELDQEFYFLLRESLCKGFGEDKNQTVAEWLEDQGINEYDEAGEEYKNITLHPFFREQEKGLEPQKIEMFFTACYNLDKFRNLIFQSSFFEKFEVDDKTRRQVKTDDYALLKFGYRWLRFALFGEKTIEVRKQVLNSKRQELKNKGKL
ncbi:MAG: YkgJ family cysteine cluster protein [Candidatus Zixiibacteriota bacterium]|nr:MAG: YkgJ family cysteine cluster protein [candidate division Zixibacteria bacterium]